MNATMISLQYRKSEESSDSESETESADENNDDEGYLFHGEEEFEANVLPQFFCGTLIQRHSTPLRRSISKNASQPPNLYINTSTGAANDTSAARSNNNERNNTIQTRTPSQGNQDINTNQNDNEDNDNRPPSPWAQSKSKQRIIDELKDSASDIHLLIGDYDDKDFNNVNFVRILQKYAGNNYKRGLFRENMKRILRHFRHKTGPFKAEEIVVEPWYTSANNVSKGYSLLFMLYMNSETSRAINEMTEEEIWDSHPEFQVYELEKFKTYNTNMKKLTGKRLSLISQEEAAYNEDMLTIPHAEITSKGYPFWNKHPASKLLEEDETSGVAREMRPKQLWASRIEYQDFPLSVFRKHIYQLRMKQLAVPYWQYKRNENATKKFQEAQKEMKEWHQAKFNKNMEGLIADWDNKVHIRDE